MVTKFKPLTIITNSSILDIAAVLDPPLQNLTLANHNITQKEPNKFLEVFLQKQQSRGFLKKRCAKNMQQIYRITPMPECNFSKVALQLYWNHTSAWVFSYKFAAYFQNTLSYEHLWMAASVTCWKFTLEKTSYKYIEDKGVKNIGFLLKAKPHLNKKCWLDFYYFCVYTYVNYANITWGSSHFRNLKKLHSKQKHTKRIVHMKDKFEHKKYLLRQNKMLHFTNWIS